LEASPAIGEVALVVPAARLAAARALVAALGWRKARVTATPAHVAQTPGAQLRAGLEALKTGSAVIVVQDGARPLLAPELVAEAVRRADEQSLIVAATPIKETIKWADAAGSVRLTPPRAALWQLQTPIVVPRSAVEDAASKVDATETDEDRRANVFAWILRTCATYRVLLVRADDGDVVRRRGDLEVAAELLRVRSPIAHA
jgi:2-C-methyl-D-erythritol 4-phosphate cytidylyltransferase